MANWRRNLSNVEELDQQIAVSNVYQALEFCCTKIYLLIEVSDRYCSTIQLILLIISVPCEGKKLSISRLGRSNAIFEEIGGISYSMRLRWVESMGMNDRRRYLHLSKH